MPERTTTIRLTEQDQRLIDELQEFTGIQSMTDLIRFAIRELARKEGVGEYGASLIAKRIRQGGTKPKPKQK